MAIQSFVCAEAVAACMTGGHGRYNKRRHKLDRMSDDLWRVEYNLMEAKSGR